MRFDEFDRKMRRFEQALDQVMIPDCYMIARLDGRSFTRLTKEICKFKAPFDTAFRDMMIATTRSLMDCGFRVIYGYTESDEISLLFALESEDFGRKLRKLNSILAGEASAKFSLLYGDIGVFDCRICELPTKDNVVDYFRWRNEDANRNALNAWCYWTLRKEGQDSKTATKAIEGISVAAKNELLFQRGINFNDLPLWQKRGIGFYWETYDRNGADRRRLKIDMDLPMGNAYGEFIRYKFLN
jgi:tRNA(His) 5'-end guanylyltransferase